MKRRSLLCAIGAIYVLNGLVMWFAAIWWFDTVPGIRMMGPFNHHFVRDIGLVYLCSGLGLLTVFRSTAVAVFAGLWPAMHAVFHISMWVHRGVPLDLVAVVNLILIQLPAWLSLWAAISLLRAEKGAL